MMNSELLIPLAIIASAGVASLLVFMVRAWVSAHVQKSVNLHYDQRFEEYRRQLQTDHELVLKRSEHMQSIANSAFAEGQRVAAENRIKAVETLWGGMIRLREKCHTALGILDMFPADQAVKIAAGQRFRELIQDITMESIAENILDQEVELIRPFIGEYSYSLYFSYRAIIGGAAFIVKDSTESGELRHWFEDEHMRQLLSNTLTTEELGQFDALRTGKLQWYRNAIEQKILAYTAKIISTELSTDEALERARQIYSVVNDMADQRNSFRP